MNLRGGLIQRGGLADAEGVVGVAVGQRRDAGIGAAVRDVGDGEELGEALVGGKDLGGDGVEDGFRDALPVFRADGRGEIFERQGEGAVGGLLGGDGLGLGEGLLHEELRRRAAVVQAGLQVGHDLREGDGNFGEARDVAVVVFSGVEGGVRGELGQVELQALVLVDGHLPLLEARGLLVVDERAQHELGGELFLVRKAGGVDGSEPLDEGAAAGQGFVVRRGERSR